MIIKDYPNYEIYEDGTIQNIKWLRMLNPLKHNKGYLQVVLYNQGEYKKFLVHRLVALHFLPKIEGKDIVDHINRNREDNRLENLRWVNKSENALNTDRLYHKNSKTKEKYIGMRTINNNDYYVLRMRRYKFNRIYNLRIYDLEYVKKIRDNIINGIESTDRTMEKK